MSRRHFENTGRSDGPWMRGFTRANTDDSGPPVWDGKGGKISRGKGKGKGKLIPSYRSDELNPYQAFDTVCQIQKESREVVLQTRVSQTITNHWSKEIREGLDERNARRMARLSIMAQETIILCYTDDSKRGPVTKRQAHIGSFIRGFRAALHTGLPYEEVLRIQSLARQGEKVSYKPCTWFPQRRCYRGDKCTHIHTLKTAMDLDDEEESDYEFGWV